MSMVSMNRQQAGVKRRSAQAGSAAVEFAFLFPLLLALIYGMVVYSYVYVLESSINYAAQEGARAAVGVDPAVGNQTAVASETVLTALNWLPTAQLGRVTVLFPACAGAGCTPASLVVQVNFALTGLFPVISLGGVMGIGDIPPLPATLSVQAVVRTS